MDGRHLENAEAIGERLATDFMCARQCGFPRIGQVLLQRHGILLGEVTAAIVHSPAPPRYRATTTRPSSVCFQCLARIRSAICCGFVSGAPLSAKSGLM